MNRLKSIGVSTQNSLRILVNRDFLNLKPFLGSWWWFYFYSLSCVLAFTLFSNDINVNLNADNILTSLSAKLGLTPYLWDDSRLGYLTSYILRPFRFLNIYVLYACEAILKAMFAAFVPIALMMLSDRKRLAYFLIPLFCLLSYYCNVITRSAISGGGFYYYFASYALFFAAQLIALKFQNSPSRILKEIVIIPILLLLCSITYWVNLSLIVFVMPYLAYLYWQGIGNKQFVFINVLGFSLPYLLSRYTEIYGKNYTEFQLSFGGFFIFIANFFLPPSDRIRGDIQVAGILCGVLCVLAVVGFAYIHRNKSIDKKFKSFYAASLLGYMAFCAIASQLRYVNVLIDDSCSVRYATLFVVFVAFWMPLACWEILHQLFLDSRFTKKYIHSLYISAAVLVNLMLILHVALHFQPPKIRMDADLKVLWQIARDQNSDVVIAGDNTKWTADYWAPWPLLFHSLARGGSLRNSIIPITFRCNAIAAQIDEALPGSSNHEPFRALCIGGSAEQCKRTTAQCGFFHFSDNPVTVSRMLYQFHDQSVPLSVLEFAPADKGKFGSLINMLTVIRPATVTPQNILHIPATNESFQVASGPSLRLLPGDYKVNLDCSSHSSPKKDDGLATLEIAFAQKHMVFRKIQFSGVDSMIKRSFIFNVPDFKFLTPKVDFVLMTTGKAELDCSEFRLTPL